MPALPSNCYKTPPDSFSASSSPNLRAAVGKREIKKSLGKN
ncbi:hypothetical protein [Acidithiobacillus sp.]